MTLRQDCPCGIDARDCTYHREQAKPEPLTFRIATVTLGGVTYEVSVPDRDELLFAHADEHILPTKEPKR